MVSIGLASSPLDLCEVEVRDEEDLAHNPALIRVEGGVDKTMGVPVVDILGLDDMWALDHLILRDDAGIVVGATADIEDLGDGWVNEVKDGEGMITVGRLSADVHLKDLLRSNRDLS